MSRAKKVILREICYLFGAVFITAGILSGCAENQRMVSNSTIRIKDQFGGDDNSLAKSNSSSFSNDSQYSQQEESRFAQSDSSSDVEANGTHVIQRGETLYSIARKYNVSPTQLASVNNLDDGKVKYGLKLRIPSSSGSSFNDQPVATASVSTKDDGVSESDDSSTSGNTDTAPSTNDVADSPSAGTDTDVASVPESKPLPAMSVGSNSAAVTYAIHTAQIGDNVTNISQKYGVSEDALCKANGFNKTSDLKPGSKVKIPVN